ncbi:hypothetical protein J4405_03225 [Candidatus Woesearchaeota archaeon]|nr:hypothetical protein [Candidatus Woesearchaeota archaeon]
MKNIIIKVIYHDIGEGFWSHENFSRYISNVPHSLNVSVEKKQGAKPITHVWYLNDYEVEVTYEKKSQEQTKIKIKLEGKPENIEAIENKIINDSGGEESECVSAI